MTSDLAILLLCPGLVSNAVFEPALDALISLDNVVLQAIAVIRDHPFASTEGALTLTAHLQVLQIGRKPWQQALDRDAHHARATTAMARRPC
jgi:hypothetical protein